VRFSEVPLKWQVRSLNPLGSETIRKRVDFNIRAASTGTGSRIEELESALGNLISWLEDDTLAIMKDTTKMGITFDHADCARLRAQIERADKVLNTPSPPVASQKGKEEE
jgi:hypothetical protein